MLFTGGNSKRAWMMFFLWLREWEINPGQKKIQDPAGIRTQDLLNTSQMLLPLSHFHPWQSSGRQAKQAALSRCLWVSWSSSSERVRIGWNLTGLWASIGVTHSYSSCLFIWALVLYIVWWRIAKSTACQLHCGGPKQMLSRTFLVLKGEQRLPNKGGW